MNRFDPLPTGMRTLPLDERGIPVPWFVDWPGGKPDFRIVDGRKLIDGWKQDLCWICGQRLFAFRAWIIGPVSLINRCTAEPPAHPECARTALTHCPFLSNPEMKRNKAALPVRQSGGGELVEHNSGLSCAWITKGRGGEMINPGNGLMFRIFEPHTVEWFRNGTRAGAEDVHAGFEDAARRLRDSDRRHGPAALHNLEGRISACARWLPALAAGPG
ncbi:hypothetical protein [Asticcacaulis solisilvae]|uniref:hypothetical protein n=1 Tax=Asticcacaulis solisilvae TaxID=1217274 RepID=UPI003FD8B87D